MNTPLLPHQEQALRKLRDSNGSLVLHVGCGGGKSRVALEYCHSINAQRVLIVAPASLLSVWEDERQKWFGASVIKIKGEAKKRKALYKTWDNGLGYYAVSYETFLRDWRTFQPIVWDVVIAEESHRMKNPVAKTTKAMFKLQALHKIALTGTMMPGGHKDAWAQVHFVAPGSLYPSYYIWRSIHCRMDIPGVPAITGYRSLDIHREKIQPHVFTVPKEELDRNLPPVTEQDIRIDLSPEEWKHYKTIRDELRIQIQEDEELTITNSLGVLLRLRQAVNTLSVFGLDVPSSKIAALVDLVDSIDPEEKIIVFTMFAESAKAICLTLVDTYLVCGETKDKDAVVAEWKKRGRILVGTKSLSEGWNLQECRYIVNFEQPYTNSELEQRNARCARQGQQRPVLIYNLIVNATIDAHVKKILEKKRHMTDELISWTRADVHSLLD
jgi:SNF2 family DNA or RNA helicase